MLRRLLDGLAELFCQLCVLGIVAYLFLLFFLPGILIFGPTVFGIFLAVTSAGVAGKCAGILSILIGIGFLLYFLYKPAEWLDPGES
ncbi:MAG: hypothetical protein A2312_04610 [Candidatus Staskawiczbacteria bacterium RIFOXYB2_FULL_32_9]|uniref:Uncharacterized protein n=1 Tax=Candidatus Staskawiczbacteria bacterium RIFOXYD1_FULL_32_13 TaxID=1802234 RepID=A0A1G2JPM1_9BACT|nr:MAG: hypothetical protein A2360_05205 [Candidatus Staskawiczbacteria bacterium RIFOXYB1_FULL_32_11]OGZ83459.1 MAG: hypothetical protein A2312_04610 [Candidatus Staskawiczbacteria bacterium RIFOXYB2_FULL_32_9]OGZ87388.1 MAG: hypothetical protein A2463_02660 [Candidatus Staskawiczbacteria bacterium RIFOXYC2_FULL_32_10]OGZ88411.1 MAG: hypothetical protein A2561_02955 [Candidatus Staskawiczbacteria bacterium RIFOXYD1_FULL_32_13]